MKLPRPLLIVLVVLLVFALIACGITALGAGQQDDSDSERRGILRNDPFVDLFGALNPRSAPIPVTAPMTSCGVSGDTLTVSGPCSISIAQSDDARRQLVLRPSTDMTMSVTVSKDGDSTSDTLSVEAGSDEGSVVLTPGYSAQITLNCSCSVRVNP